MFFFFFFFWCSNSSNVHLILGVLNTLCTSFLTTRPVYNILGPTQMRHLWLFCNINSQFFFSSVYRSLSSLFGVTLCLLPGIFFFSSQNHRHSLKNEPIFSYFFIFSFFVVGRMERVTLHLLTINKIFAFSSRSTALEYMTKFFYQDLT